MTDEGLCRVGWSTLKGGRELGGLFVDCMRDMVCCPAVSHVLQVRMVRALGLVVQGRNHSAVSLMIMARWDNCPCTHNWQSSCNRTLDRKTDKLSYTILQEGPTHESYPCFQLCKGWNLLHLCYCEFHYPSIFCCYIYVSERKGALCETVW